jgi:hypothetical protein
MIYSIEWIENKTPRCVQFNCKADCVAWCEKYAPELLIELEC